MIIDAGSKDTTSSIIESFRKNTDKISVFTYPRSSIGFARQEGTKHSNGDYCAFVDSDCILPSKDWLSRMMAGFTGPDIAGTWTLGAYNKDDPSIMKYSIISNPLRGRAPEQVGQDNFVPVGTGHTILRKKDILDAGGFRDLPAAEDIDLIKRLVDRGFFFRYIHGAEVYHYHVTSFSGLLRKTRRNIVGGLRSAAWQGEFLGGRMMYRNVLKGAWNVSIVGPFLFGIFKAIRDHEWAWLWHPYVSFCNVVITAQLIVLKKER